MQLDQANRKLTQQASKQTIGEKLCILKCDEQGNNETDNQQNIMFIAAHAAAVVAVGSVGRAHEQGLRPHVSDDAQSKSEQAS